MKFNLNQLSKLILTLIGVVSPISTAFAAVRVSTLSKVRVSLFGLGNTSTLRGSNITGSTFQRGPFGYGGGIGIEFPISQEFGLELNAVYINRKVIQSFEFAGPTHFNSNYVMAPLLLRYHLGNFFSLNTL